MDAHTTSSAVMIIKIIVTPPRASLGEVCGLRSPSYLWSACESGLRDGVELRPISDALILLFALERVMPR